MKNYKRILAAIGTAALLVSNVGAVSQVVFADEADIVESVQDNVVDVSQDDVTAQVQEIIDNALATTAEDTETQEVAETEVVTPEETTEVTTPETTEVTTPETTETSTEQTSDETTTDTTDETVVDETTTDETTDVVTDTTTDTTVTDATTVTDPTTDVVEDPTLVDTEVVDEETEEEQLVSEAFDDTVPVEGTDGKISVHATAGENTIPNDVVLVASLITKEDNEDEYNKVEQALVDSDNVEYTAEDAAVNNGETVASNDEDIDEESTESEATGAGFIAMDIRFERTDEETGETVEVEPQGVVNITFDIAEDVLPVGVDEESVAVHHLEEDADTGEVKDVVTVADTTSNPDTGSVDVQKSDDENTAPTATVGFEVGSFSTFTITWEDGGPDNDGDEVAYIHYVYDDGSGSYSEIPGSNTVNYHYYGDKPFHKDMTEVIDLLDFADAVDGKVFSGIKVYDKSTGKYKDAEFLQWVKDKGYGTSSNEIRAMTISGYSDDGSKKRAKIDYTIVARDISSLDFYIVYKDPAPYTPDTDPQGPTVSGDKEVTENTDDGTYDLTLSVTPGGDTESTKTALKIDVVYVLDTSYSMIANFIWQNVDENTSVKRMRADVAREAILTSLDTFKGLEEAGEADIWYSLVTFNSYAAVGRYQQGLTDNPDSISNMLEDGGGLYNSNKANNGGAKSGTYDAYGKDTNYEAAFVAARQVLEHSRSDAKTIVIFLTDGLPTQAFNSDGKLWGDGTEDSARDLGDNHGDNFVTRATSEEQKLGLSKGDGDAFYIYGIGTGLNRSDYDTYCAPLKTAITATTGGDFIGDDVERLLKDFKDISAKMVSQAKEVKIIDSLSDYVDYVDGSRISVKITDTTATDGDVVIASGDITAGSAFTFKESSNGDKSYTVTPKVTTNSGKQTIEVEFQSDYELHSGWEYEFTVKVKPSTDAYAYYRNNGLKDDATKYPDTADADTGTYASQKGFYTNVTNEAKITYKYTDTNGESKKGTDYTYKKPVIQIKPGKLVISKTITGLDSDKIDSAMNGTSFAVTLKSGGTPLYTSTVNLSDAKVAGDNSIAGGTINRVDNGNNRTFTITLYGMDTDASYEVTETAAEIANYTLTTEKSNETGTIAWNDSKTASFVNNYMNKIVKTGVVADNNMFPALVATIDIMAAMFVVYGIAKRRVR